ncbi:hypothetical protein KA005_60930 [bacterium]|nr:hypothetical protein [bacterium]
MSDVSDHQLKPPKSFPWVIVIGVILLIGIGIGLYFVLTHKNSSTDSPPPGITPADTAAGVDGGGVDGGGGDTGGGDGGGGGSVDAEWITETSVDGDLQKQIICDGRTTDGGIICNNQEDCLDIASTDWRDHIQFVTYENEGYGEDGKYGQCTGWNFPAEAKYKYKMITIGSCATMEKSNIDTEGLEWSPIDDIDQCDESMKYLSDNDLIIPGGTWYETALNNSSDPNGPIQIKKNEDGKTILSAYLKCESGSSCPSVRGIKSKRVTQEVAYDNDGNIRSYRNDDGKFKEKKTQPWRTPPGETGIFEAKENSNSERPSGCYVNLGTTSPLPGQSKDRTGSLWFNSAAGTGAKRQRPVVCKTATNDPHRNENSSLAYID